MRISDWSSDVCSSDLWQERVRHHHQDCDLRDLYRDNFDPVLKANEQPGKEGYAPRPENVAEREHLEKLDVLTFVYPVWFGTPPAMLKGYLERVVRSEEHTSELQSLMRISYAVICLKKKKTQHKLSHTQDRPQTTQHI